MLHRIICPVACLMAIGCGQSGPKMARVTGTITFDNTPIPTGRVAFFPSDSTVGPVETEIRDGQFDCLVPLGSCRVEIRADREVAGQKDKVMGLRPHEAYIPARYNRKSELKAEVQDVSNNQVSFALVSKVSTANKLP